MKRTFPLILCIILILPFFAFQPAPADALGAVWVKEYYKDKFGDTTDRYYLTILILPIAQETE